MQYPASDLVIDPVLIRKYDAPGPRYTSYPTADRFVEAFDGTDLRQWLARRNIGGYAQPLALHVQLPAGNARGGSASAKYIKHLERELAMLAPLLGDSRTVAEMHWGGGAPAFLSAGEARALVAVIDGHVRRAPYHECSVELDPRYAAPGTLALLGSLGFNRVSFGAHAELTPEVLAEARASGLHSVRLELGYALPRQTLDGFSRTLDRVLELDPDRIALHDGAHAASAELKLQLLTLAIGRLARAGYLYIGMDEFARPDDELAAAQAQGRLWRGPQGYSTHAGDRIALGVSAIGRVGPACYQNDKVPEGYYRAIDAGRLPVARGIELTADDLVRGAVIEALNCHFRVSIDAIELAHLVEFRRYFAPELADLRQLAREELIELAPDWILVTPKGRLLVRAICTVFDRYQRTRTERAACSKVI